MTAICRGGTSGPKPGVAHAVIYGSGALATILVESGNPWLIALAPVMGVISYDVTNMCDRDPPAMPEITAADVIAMATLGDYQAHIVAAAKFNAVIANLVWATVCQCDDGLAPTPPPLVPEPPGLPNLTDLYGHIGPALPCERFISAQKRVFNLEGLPPGNTPLVPDAGGFQRYNSGSRMTATAKQIPNGANHNGIWVDINTYFADHSLAQNWHSFLLVSGETQTFTFNLAVGAVFISAGAGSNGTTVSTDLVQLALDIFCTGGDNNAYVSPCCPADQLLIGLAQQTYQLVQLIQRQVAPFAYVPGVSHSGLTGNGQLIVQGLIGAKITITDNVPGVLSVQAGNPEFVWDAGWINWGSADGFTPREFLSATSTLSLPPDAGAYTVLGYSIAAGVTVTIQELHREA